MSKYLLIPCLLILTASCSTSKKQPSDLEIPSFSFAFLTDIHLKPELGATVGFQLAIDSVNALNPDFVLTGGDLIDDALYATRSRADSLYRLYNSMAEGFNMPVYNAMGNHEHYGFNSDPPVDPADPDYGDRMYEKMMGERYYSFDHEGWHFMILEGTKEGEGKWGNYVGAIDQEQMEWIRKDLENLEPTTPIVLVTHIPLVSIEPQIVNGPLYADNQSALITNQQEVLAPFREMNLKLVLQGHLHFLEDLNLMERTRFITGGAVSGRWWRTPDDSPFQEGFVMVEVKGDEFTWRYVDYGWETGISSAN